MVSSVVCAPKLQGPHRCPQCGSHIHVKGDNHTSEEEGYGTPVLRLLCFNAKSVVLTRQSSEENLKLQAKKMKRLSDNMFPLVEGGITVCVPTSEFNKG